jgi:hypothetical protein
MDYMEHEASCQTPFQALRNPLRIANAVYEESENQSERPA